MAQGFIIWFTGLSGSGKSTLAAKVADRLRAEGVHVEALDGDDVRKHLSWGLGFSREDRDRNVRRIGYVARLVARSGACAITAAISPFRAIREEIRNQTDRFCEVYTECPIEVLAERDPKGLYKKALAGEIKNFTGVTDPYEPPDSPEIHVRTDLHTEAECLEIIIERLREMGYLSDATERVQMPEPYAGELLCVPEKAELVGTETVSIDAELAEEVRAICAGFLSPVAGFMPGREVEKVEALGHLELGFPWPTAQVLPVPETQSGIAAGSTVVLSEGSERLAELHAQEVFVRDGRHYLAGPLQAVAPEGALPVTARALRQSAYEAGLRYFALVVARTKPTPGSAAALSNVAAACDGLVLLAAQAHLAAWREIAGDERVELLPKYLESHAEFDQIVGKNIGASRVLSSLE